ncbi:hypothetical protein [Mycolicibacterium iranicum]|uniref:Transmembrane protein n=1 Tax=Mycolicibacterium iranicum TaxID=912594 RepID=A0A1X1WSK7_MYCIR|nr:hypothetical protein [Mycolicibacterium iranicum]ORV89645.1 hypothetical protein AWC12_09550 [Mycolicibacterium iranicum]
MNGGKSRRRAVVELLVAGLAALGCVVAWLSASTEVVVAPVLDGEPSTISQVYYAPMLTLSLLLAATAGVLAVVGIARLRRGPAKPPAQ